MNAVLRDAINHKVRNLTVKELLRESSQQGIPLTVREAKRLIGILHAESFDAGDKKQISRLMKNLEKEFPHHYPKAENLFHQYKHLIQ